MVTSKLRWWKKTVVYQIYPRSFCDSNRDGIGDLNGILSKLDYLEDLGVETIWFSPYFTSPQKDFGYDVTDFCDIDLQYGDMKISDKLIDEIHKRDMKIVLDLVLNHTSDQHPWFIESRSSRYNPKRDWYIWRDGKGKKPPNNWWSMIGGSGWQYDKKNRSMVLGSIFTISTRFRLSQSRSKRNNVKCCKVLVKEKSRWISS